MVQANNASNYIQWQVIRKNSAFLKRQRGINKLFSTERFNLMSVNSFRYNGFVSKAAVDVQANKDGKGVTLTVKTKKNLPTKKKNSFVLRKDGRRTLKIIKGVLAQYKPAHTKLAQKRASKILLSQKPLKSKKPKNE